MSNSQEDVKTTPMMAQWHACKLSSKGALLFFRLGDFYELFYEDASIASKELDLTFTKRQGIPMCGVPAHTVDGYIDKLIAKGIKVAVAEQTEDPKKVKGLVKREVVRIVTPGSLVNSPLLSEKNNNYFACVVQIGKLFGLSVIDISTGDFRVVELELNELENELYRFRPKELLVSLRFQEKHPSILQNIQRIWPCLISTQEGWRFELPLTCQSLLSHFKVHTLEGFGISGMTAGIAASGALLLHLKDALHLSLEHVFALLPENILQHMSIDLATLRHLELTESIKDGSSKGTLLSVLDHTLTPMGSRLLYLWIQKPLISKEAIKERQDAIESLLLSPTLRSSLALGLSHIRDLERLSIRISLKTASPKDFISLAHSLKNVPLIKKSLEALSSAKLKSLSQDVESLPQLIHLIESTLVDEPPYRLGEAAVFRRGVSKELDQLRDLKADSKTWLLNYQNDLKDKLGIKTLKVGYTKMFGYYIEVSRGQADKVPSSFQRRQTLVNQERYLSPELKNFEHNILHAEEKIEALENALFLSLKKEVETFSKSIQKTAKALSFVDCFLSLATAAEKGNYVRPKVDDGEVLFIEAGRHPVIESLETAPFIPNDTLMNNDERLSLITGPNMAGKSTYIRQVALISILAHIGSYVPAKAAHIGIIDKVFSRIGASDDLASGLSTFMVEMTETANILHNATCRSLVILDEIGRGTSTYDGISIAWSVAEYLLTCEGKLAKTLFATHYFELTKLEEKVPGAVNYTVAVQETGDHIVFLRRIIKGGTDKSYGIHVARLAGLPPPVIARAKEILVHLEENANQKNLFEPSRPKKIAHKQKAMPLSDLQLTLF